jgi:hypothetical protein
MAHFTVCIVVKDDKSDIDTLTGKVASVLNEFSTELEVNPYRRYISGDDLAHMKSHYRAHTVDELVGQTWHGGEPAQLDENGLYVPSTSNPNGHFDYANILGRVLPKDFGLAFLGEGCNRVCRAMVTLDGQWLDGPWNFGEPTDPNGKKESTEWHSKLASILEQHKHEAIFIADCHS